MWSNYEFGQVIPRPRPGWPGGPGLSYTTEVARCDSSLVAGDQSIISSQPVIWLCHSVPCSVLGFITARMKHPEPLYLFIASMMRTEINYIVFYKQPLCTKGLLLCSANYVLVLSKSN